MQADPRIERLYYDEVVDRWLPPNTIGEYLESQRYAVPEETNPENGYSGTDFEPMYQDKPLRRW